MDQFTIMLCVAAFLTSALSGMAGLGGGTILIAVFFAMGMTPAEAVPLFAAVQFVSNSSRTIAYLGDVSWTSAAWFSLTVVPASLMAAQYALAMDVDAVRLLLALLILISLIRIRGSLINLPLAPASLLAGLLNGGLGMFVGATGLFVGRLFFRPEWRKQTTIATLALTQVMGHALRVLIYGLVGFSAFAQPMLLLTLCIAVILGTALGKKMNARLSAAQFRALFNSILIILSAKLMLDALRGFGWM